MSKEGNPQHKQSTESEAERMNNSFQLEPVRARIGYEGILESTIEEVCEASQIREGESHQRARENTSRCYNCGHIYPKIQF